MPGPASRGLGFLTLTGLGCRSWRTGIDTGVTGGRPKTCPGDSSHERGDASTSGQPWDMLQAAKSIRVRSAGVKTTVHRCDSLLVCVLFSAHQAAGSHNAHAFRTPFRGRPEATIWRGDFEEKARETKVASPGADKPGAMMRVRALAV